ncbi:exportin, putative, partial [Eimeria tenella]
MQEPFPGVRDMACETFLKVANKCKTTIAANHQEDERNFVLSVIENHTQQTEVLDEKQQLLFFEAVGHIISATPAEVQASCIEGLMANSWEAWQQIVKSGKENQLFLFNPQAAKRLVQILRINQRVA